MNYFKNNIYTLLLVVTGISFLVFCYPFAAWIVFAAIICFALKPIQNKVLIKKYKINKTFSVYLIMFFLVLLMVPFILSFFSFFSEGKNLSEKISQGDSVESVAELVDKIYESAPYLSEWINKKTATSYVLKGAQRLVEPTIKIASGFFLGLPMFFLNLFIFSASLFYFISDSAQINSFVKSLNLMEKSDLDDLVKTIQVSCQSTLFAAVITGAAQALILSVAAAVVGVNFIFTLFFITFFASQIPLIGVAPISIGLFLFTYSMDNTMGMILILVAGILASISDNIIRAWILSRYDSLHPLAGLISAIGGLIILGPIGVLLGPVVTLLFVKILKINYVKN